MATVEFSYEGYNTTIQCQKYDTISTIIQSFSTECGVEPNSVHFLYNGTKITNSDLTFEQLANTNDKTRNKMNILVISSKTPSSQFIFGDYKVADERMKDYAKMAILLAMEEYPGNYQKQSELIAIKFEERYGNRWSVSY